MDASLLSPKPRQRAGLSTGACLCLQKPWSPGVQGLRGPGPAEPPTVSPRIPNTHGWGRSGTISGDPSTSKGGSYFSHWSEHAKGECGSKDTHRQLCPGSVCGLHESHPLWASGSPCVKRGRLSQTCLGFQIPSPPKNTCVQPYTHSFMDPLTVLTGAALHPHIPDQEALAEDARPPGDWPLPNAFQLTAISK